MDIQRLAPYVVVAVALCRSGIRGTGDLEIVVVGVGYGLIEWKEGSGERNRTITFT